MHEGGGQYFDNFPELDKALYAIGKPYIEEELEIEFEEVTDYE